MAIPNEICSVRMAIAYFFVRTSVYLLGLGAVAWGGFLLPIFWRQAPLDQLASELLQGYTFESQTLVDQERQLEAAGQSPFCNPTVSRDVVILRLTIMNEAIATKNQKRIEAGYAPLYDSIRRSLSCAPADPFTWLALFWLDAGKHGLHPDNANYLRLSYALGPNEGWIALWRSRLAMTMFAQLPNDLSNDAIDEFIKLVDTGQLYSQTAAIFAGATLAAQNRIVEKLKSVSPMVQQIFAQTLYENGFKIDIPGIHGPTRPWQ